MSSPSKVAIMQPYFFPYIGYWQLMKAVDCFVVYDNIEFTKKGWIHRNRFLQQGEPELFTLPLKKDSDFLSVRQRALAERFVTERVKLARRIEAAYRKAPYFTTVFPLWQQCLAYESTDLFDFILHSMKKISGYLEVATPIIVSSELQVDHQLRGQDKVLAICQALGAAQYYNPIGGRDLYQADAFSKAGIALFFQQSRTIQYPQFGEHFQPSLSILDVMMFNPVEAIHQMLQAVEWTAAKEMQR